MKKKAHVIACAVLAVDLKHSAREQALDVEYKFLEAGPGFETSRICARPLVCPGFTVQPYDFSEP